jgi:hypothetical protein
MKNKPYWRKLIFCPSNISAMEIPTKVIESASETPSKVVRDNEYYKRKFVEDAAYFHSTIDGELKYDYSLFQTNLGKRNIDGYIICHKHREIFIHDIQSHI